MNYNQLINSIDQNKLAPLYLITGKQDYLIEQLRNKFTQIVPEEERTMNFAAYDMETTPLSDAMNDALSAPFFGEHRLVMINNPMFLTGERNKGKVEHDVDTLVNYIKQPLNSTILVLIAPYDKLDARKKVVKLLKQNATIVDLHEFNEAETINYVKQFLNQHHYDISNQVMNQLVQRTDGQLSVIMNDLPKLMLFCQRSHEITEEAVENLVTKTLNQDIFTLVDLVLKRRTTDAVSLYQELLMNGQSAIQINAVLLSQFRLLLQTMILKNYGYSQGKLAGMLKVHPYRVKLALRTITKHHLNDLKLAYLGLVEIEKQLKSTSESPELLFEMFMLKFA
ncbi:DNA polymerase III subunit delta [Nicoliella lavandulae]|uniref:DNA polymerase III subunit delta n=1 Tax=Nicoliella lavandulae TaxID=3082954 RepID=A0ABU8SLL7_9LACO